MPRKVKRTKLKGKPSTVTQKVIVNVSKGGGRRKPSGPPPPSQAQQLFQTLAPLLAQRQGPQLNTLQSIQPLLQSQQQLQNLVAQLAQRPGPQGPQGERGFIGPQGPRGFPGRDAFLQQVEDQGRDALLQQARQVAEETGLGKRGTLSVAEPYTPSLESSSRSSLPSFAFDFGIQSPLQSSSGKSFVLEQPDAPLLTPAQPAVSGGPQRLDPPHEDVPLRVIDGVGEGKEEDQVRYVSQYQMPRISDVTKEYIESLPRTSSAKTAKITLKMFTEGLGLQYTRVMDKMKKAELVDYLWTQTQKKQKS